VGLKKKKGVFVPLFCKPTVFGIREGREKLARKWAQKNKERRGVQGLKIKPATFLLGGGILSNHKTSKHHQQKLPNNWEEGDVAQRERGEKKVSFLTKTRVQAGQTSWGGGGERISQDQI